MRFAHTLTGIGFWVSLVAAGLAADEMPGSWRTIWLMILFAALNALVWIATKERDL